MPVPPERLVYDGGRSLLTSQGRFYPASNRV
jgi:hypothetical protein